MHIVNVQK